MSKILPFIPDDNAFTVAFMTCTNSVKWPRANYAGARLERIFMALCKLT